MTLIQKLQNIVTRKFASDDIYVRHAYSRNVHPDLQGVPEYVVRPKDAKEISEILKVANEENIPVIPRGGGDCEWGGSIATGDVGIILDMKRMDNIVNLDEENLICTVEAGISWGKLNEYLSRFGLYTGCMGPGSGLTASIGGGISHHSVGAGGCAKYGACTNQLVSLEVVLPTGEIIETGSQANKFSKFPFNRFGNGPDLAGLFCGDNGIYGVKTKVSLQVFPKPPFANYKTFLCPRNSAEVVAQIFTEIRQKGIDVYDAMYIDEILIKLGTNTFGMYPMFEHLKRKRGIVFYVVEANSEQELDEKVKQLDKIFLHKKCEDLGPEMSNGNFAKWHYTEGQWQTYHNCWGIIPVFENITTECFTPINSFPKILKDIEKWDMENEENMKKIEKIAGFRPISGTGVVPLVDGNNVELTCGFTTFGCYHDGEYHEIIKDINLKLWKSLLTLVLKHGVQFYMMGSIPSRLIVEIGAYTSEYYNLMKSIKKTLDPHMILSRGKFNFWEDD